MNAPFAIEREPEPIEIDSRPCQLCGLTIDRHEMVDDGEGPVFFCTVEIDEVPPADIVWQPQMPEPRRRAEPYRPPESTVQAFWYVARNHDADYLAAWLAKHPVDQAYLFRIWKAKRCST